jgi:hypothetical protein
MAFSPTDQASRSLWMQLRNTKGKHRPRWRSDWTPLWVSVLFFSVLLICYAIMPSNDGVNHAEQYLFARCIQCHHSREIDDYLARVLWM